MHACVRACMDGCVFVYLLICVFMYFFKYLINQCVYLLSESSLNQLPEKRGRKPGTSWNGETRVERMGGISAGVGGGGGSARLYWVPFWNPWGEGRNVQETWHTILDTPYVAFYIPHWTGSTLDFTVYTIESTPLHFILYKLYFTFLALHCTPDTPQEQETMGFSNLSIKYDNDGVP